MNSSSNLIGLSHGEHLCWKCNLCNVLTSQIARDIFSSVIAFFSLGCEYDWAFVQVCQPTSGEVEGRRPRGIAGSRTSRLYGTAPPGAPLPTRRKSRSYAGKRRASARSLFAARGPDNTTASKSSSLFRRSVSSYAANPGGLCAAPPQGQARWWLETEP